MEDTAVVAAPRQPAPEKGVPTAAGPAVRARHILAAEDNPVNQRLLVRMLQKRGHTVVLTSNGLEAVEAYGRERFDVALFDIQMPEMSGLEATAAIRAKERECGAHSHIPIVAITANAMHGDRERCLAAGMDAYIAKPIHQGELFEMVENLSIIQEPASRVHLDTALFDGDPEFLAEIVNLFLATCPELLSSVEDAVARKDPNAVCRAAHTLKGAVANFGAEAVVEQAKALEMVGRGGDMTHAGEILQSLRSLIAALQPELEAALEKATEKQVLK
jgi:CheY-like chemotaxis protein